MAHGRLAEVLNAMVYHAMDQIWKSLYGDWLTRMHFVMACLFRGEVRVVMVSVCPPTDDLL